FGTLRLEDEKVTAFVEKPEGQEGWINAGFFVLEPKVIDFIDGDSTSWERQPLERISSEGQLSVFKHRGFWQPMDTQRDHRLLNDLWSAQTAPWKSW
ncbi:MAG: glucose-1-phosphate cytidylyltransferase, partial [Candidatus Obscuribacterales bacterium]|nr:glucose-1-phosphate cytidylyltransferase [Candidatus Obscuribacterales bacterium]